MRNWSLNSKVYSIIALFVVVCATISYVGISQLDAINDALNKIVDKDAKRIEFATEIESTYLTQIISEKNMIIEQEKIKMEEFDHKINEDYKKIQNILEEWRSNSSAQGKVKINEFSDAYLVWWELNKKVRTLALNQEDKAAFDLSRGKSLEARIHVEKIIDEAVIINKNFMKTSSEETDVLYENARMLLLIISIGAALAGLITTFFVMRSVSTAIEEVISSLTDNSNQVTSAAQQIASSSEELSQASTEQSSALEETAASIEELSSMVQKNADNAKKTSEIAGGSKQNAGKGKEVMGEMILAIDDINVSNASIMNSINESNKKISEIVDVIAEIGNKTKVINDIVFQTKLLSFNASVEAARAGEHGKGFAVVAEEVGNLAQMSGNAAKEITSLLDGSILKVQSIVNETKSKVEHLIVDGKAKVDRGTSIAKECGIVLDEIVSNITVVNEMSDEIAVACLEQAQGVSEITKAMGQLDQVTQINTATSQETASSAEQLSAQAVALRGVVKILVETIKGKNSSARVENQYQVPVKKEVTKNNVVAFKVKKTTAPASKPMNRTIGQDNRPSESDPRFEAV